MLKAVIIDDEQDSREILANYVTKYCTDVEVCGFGQSVKTGLEVIGKFKPDIVFLDIEMPYGNGFDLIEQVPDLNFETVFVTAFDNYAIKALNLSAAYYILKPIDIDELIAAVEKIKSEKAADNYIEHSKVLFDNIQVTNKQQQKVMLPTMEGFELVRVTDVIYCEADDNFTRFFLKDGRKLLICRTLKFFEQTLEDCGFMRIHRSYVVNLDCVVKYTKGKGGFVTLESGQELEVSHAKKKTLFERL